MGAGMKYFMIVFSLYFSAFSLNLIPQEKEIREDIVVTNVEIPVRVLHKGIAIDNLKKEDFQLYENGSLIPIHGFNVIRKQLSVETLDIESNTKTSLKTRYFVLVFTLVDYNQHIRDGLKYIFDNVLHENDKLLILANNKLVGFENLEEKNKKHKEVELLLKNQGKIARNNLTAYLKKVERKLRFKMRQFDDRHYEAYDILKNYLETWREYKQRYLTPDIRKYYGFANYLEKINFEKWVLNFYQIELFPKMRRNRLIENIRGLIDELRTNVDSERRSFASILDKLLMEIYKEEKMENLFPIEEISKLFLKVNATFHTIFIPTSIIKLQRNFEYRNVATQLENNLREITKRTGGTLITTSNLSDAIQKISKKVDIVYLLTYAPKSEKIKGKIKIKLLNKEYKVYYDDNIRADYISKFLKKMGKNNKLLKMQSLRFSNKKLSFNISNITLTNKAGSIKIGIVIKDGSNKIVYNQVKNLRTINSNISLNILLKWIKKGKYYFTLSVSDLLINKQISEYLKADVK